MTLSKNSAYVVKDWKNMAGLTKKTSGKKIFFESLGLKILGRREHNIGDNSLKLGLAALSVSIILLFFVLSVILFFNAWPALRHWGLNFYIRRPWVDEAQDFGALTSIYGTVMTALISLLIAMPLSILNAIFLVEIKFKFISKILRTFWEVMAGMPTIALGLWATYALVPLMQSYIEPFLISGFGPESLFADFWSALIGILFYPLVIIFHVFFKTEISLEATQFHFSNLFAGPPAGMGLLTAAIVLSLMQIPSMTLLFRELFTRSIRRKRDSIIALGATRWETIKFSMLIPNHKAIWLSSALALGRAMGETILVLMCIGGKNQISDSLLEGAQSMTSLIVNEFAGSSPLKTSALMAVAFGLFVITVFIQWLQRFLLDRTNS